MATIASHGHGHGARDRRTLDFLLGLSLALLLASFAVLALG